MTADDAHDALRTDPDLGPVVEEHGPLTIDPAEDTFRRLATAIINQQLSSASAAAIRDRVQQRFSITPEGMLAASEDDLREAGLSKQKIRYLRNVAEAYRENDYGPDYFADASDEAVVEELTEITGVGTWTAKMYLISCLGREDVFPVEDLGIRRGLESLCGEMTRAEMVERAADWRPYRSYAALYLWRVHD